MIIQTICYFLVDFEQRSGEILVSLTGSRTLVSFWLRRDCAGEDLSCTCLSILTSDCSGTGGSFLRIGMKCLLRASFERHHKIRFLFRCKSEDLTISFPDWKSFTPTSFRRSSLDMPTTSESLTTSSCVYISEAGTTIRKPLHSTFWRLVWDEIPEQLQSRRNNSSEKRSTVYRR